MKKVKLFLTFFLFTLIFILLGFLYIIGFLNYFDSTYLKKIQFFDLSFLPKYVTIGYIFVLTFFLFLLFILIFKMIKSSKDEANTLTALDVDEYSLDVEKNKDDVAEVYNKLIDSLDKKISSIKKYAEIIDGDIEKIDKVNYELMLQKSIESIYQNFSHMITDIISATSVSELFDKVIYWASTLSNSQRGSLMLVDKDRQLYIYKTVGWDSDEFKKYGSTKIPLGVGISGKVASENKRIFVTNIENYDEFDFKNRYKYKTKSFISMPIFGIKNVIAVLNLTENKEGLYTINELEIVNILTKVTSKVFEMIQLKKRLGEKRK